MPPKPTTNNTPKSKATLAKARKPKDTFFKQPPKEKTPVKTPTPSPESKSEADSLIPLHSPFVYSPSNPQEKNFHFNDKYENEKDSDNHGSAASEDESILEWDLHAFANIYNDNMLFKAPCKVLPNKAQYYKLYCVKRWDLSLKDIGKYAQFAEVFLKDLPKTYDKTKGVIELTNPKQTI
ncbi:hypothetical protein DSO57_1022807 [Entomophthora muscae]|uniref:Uncharacterized protein n=1 Tax=Entomophthora muscae TaxID=34485 RepID=A0ACC2UD75_9FUNG|nr:hypothetical protein DSO57_1022807 [Entomophthora muscae]